MKTLGFLLLISYIDLIFAGGIELDENQANQALQLWHKHCLSGNTNTNPQIHCKFGEDTNNVDKVVIRPSAPPPKPLKQIIFIEPPVYNYNHQITLEQPAEPPRKTTIYVFPPKSAHQYQVQDNREKPQRVKPIVYFLKNGHLFEKENNDLSKPTADASSIHRKVIEYNQPESSGSNNKVEPPLKTSDFMRYAEDMTGSQFKVVVTKPDEAQTTEAQPESKVDTEPRTTPSEIEPTSEPTTTTTETPQVVEAESQVRLPSIRYASRSQSVLQETVEYKPTSKFQTDTKPVALKSFEYKPISGDFKTVPTRIVLKTVEITPPKEPRTGPKPILLKTVEYKPTVPSPVPQNEPPVEQQKVEESVQVANLDDRTRRNSPAFGIISNPSKIINNFEIIPATFSGYYYLGPNPKGNFAL